MITAQLSRAHRRVLAVMDSFGGEALVTRYGHRKTAKEGRVAIHARGMVTSCTQDCFDTLKRLGLVRAHAAFSEKHGKGITVYRISPLGRDALEGA